MAFHLLETTIDAIQAAYRAGELSARDLVQLYLNRIEAYDKKGPNINAIITIAPDLLEQADRLDAAYGTSGPVGPLHGVPVILKDQLDAKGTPTTLGSILLKDYYPDRDAFVTDKLRQAGAIILGKATLGELGGGDTHGTLFGSTRNPWDLERTAGGSSWRHGGRRVGQLRRHRHRPGGLRLHPPAAAWNGIVGMRPTAGLVSRGGVYDGWPGIAGSLGPLTRTVRDLAILLDVMVGYDPDDPITALGVGKVPATYTASLDSQGLQGARIGILRESMGRFSEPGTRGLREGRPGIRRGRGGPGEGGRDAGGSRGHPAPERATGATRERRARRLRSTVGRVLPPERQVALQNHDRATPDAGLQAHGVHEGRPRRAAVRAPAGQGNPHVQCHEGDGGPPTRRHRAPDRGAPAHPHPRWREPALRQHQGGDPHQHLPGIRLLDVGPRRVHLR